jgi:molybdopterin converting factor small subunit
MARVLVKLYGVLRERLGKPQLWVEARTAAEAAAAVVREGGPEAAKVLYDEAGAVRSVFVLSLDSEILDRGALDEVALQPGGVLHIFPPISGG